jgi:hypothetical protein
MLGRTMLGKLPLFSNSLANFSVGESLEAAFCHVAPEFAQIYRICLSIWMSPTIGAACVIEKTPLRRRSDWSISAAV